MPRPLSNEVRPTALTAAVLPIFLTPVLVTTMLLRVSDAELVAEQRQALIVAEIVEAPLRTLTAADGPLDATERAEMRRLGEETLDALRRTKETFSDYPSERPVLARQLDTTAKAVIAATRWLDLPVEQPIRARDVAPLARAHATLIAWDPRERPPTLSEIAVHAFAGIVMGAALALLTWCAALMLGRWERPPEPDLGPPARG